MRLLEENPRGFCILPDDSSCKCPTNTSRRVSLTRRLNETSWRTQAKTKGADLNEESKIDVDNGAASVPWLHFQTVLDRFFPTSSS